MNDRRYSLLIPWFMDAALSLVQTAVPLLALRLGASAILLGTIGWVAQAVRLPICFTSGRLSERVGRTRFIIPAALVIAAASIGLARSQSTTQVMVLYTVALACIGAFYPPLQALIGDVSRRGELTKNLGSFNIGWCIGGAVAAIGAWWLVAIGLAETLYVAAVGFVVTAVLVAFWHRATSARTDQEEQAAAAAPQDTGPLLIIARAGLFTGFFGFAVIRMMFPKLGISLGWTESNVAMVVAWVVVGQAAGMLATSASPWWRGRLWPQVMAQVMMLVSGLVICVTSSAVVMGGAFFCAGAALSVAYTAALYHGLSARKAMGKNSGTHEALVAAGGISGCLLGGLVAQGISLRAPYALLAVLAVVCLAVTAMLAGAASRKAAETIDPRGP